MAAHNGRPNGRPEQIREKIMVRELKKRSTGESLGGITISIGVASHRPGERPRPIIERADACLYEAKRAGRNCTKHEDSKIPISRGGVMPSPPCFLSDISGWSLSLVGSAPRRQATKPSK
jgi:Diguanylate cyclase, GGDEF domain